MAISQSTSKSFLSPSINTAGWVLQPDYSWSNNGYGLLQLNANLVTDSKSVEQMEQLVRGRKFSEIYASPDTSKYANFTLVKASINRIEGEMVKATVNFAGIAQGLTGGAATDTEAFITSSAVSEPIESHPNFTKHLVNEIGDPGITLGGYDAAGNPPTDPNQAGNKFHAKWTNVSQSSVPTWQFVAFIPTQDSTKPINIKAGIKSWMRPSITVRMIAYTAKQDFAEAAGRFAGCVTTNGDFGPFILPPVYKNIGLAGPFVKIEGMKATSRNWLVTSCNVEVFGGLFKVQADMMLSGVCGWDSDIYEYRKTGP